MRLFRLATFIITICFSCISTAEVTPMPSPKPEGELDLIIVASGTPEFINEWVSTPSSHGVTIKRLKTAKPNQLIVSAFLVSGVSPDKAGNFSFSVSYYVLDPNDKAIFGERNYSKGSGIMPKVPTFIMGDPALDLILEDSDPEGVYTIVAQAIDLVSGKKVSDSYTIRFVKNGLKKKRGRLRLNSQVQHC